MRFIVFLVLIVGIFAANIPVEPSKSTLSFLPKFKDLIHKSMQQKNVPGLAVAIVMDGKIIFMQGFGVKTIGCKEPVNIHTIFQIGSASKAITSVLIAILNREQIISLDHPIGIIPNATVRHVMSHTTGISSAGFNALIEKGMPADQIYNIVSATAPDDLPGKKFAYHNVVYNLVEGIIQDQTGMSFEDALQANLLMPLHMNETSSTWQGFVSKDNRVSVHAFTNGKVKKGKAVRNVQKVPYRRDYANFPAAGGCSSSIHDMALFLAAILGSRPDILLPNDLDLFIKPLVHTPDQWYRSRAHRNRITKTHYGLGWRVMTFGDHNLVFHGGWIRGINALISFLPEKKIGVVILQNAESGLPFSLSMQFYDWFLNLPGKQWVK